MKKRINTKGKLPIGYVQDGINWYKDRIEKNNRKIQMLQSENRIYNKEITVLENKIKRGDTV